MSSSRSHLRIILPTALLVVAMLYVAVVALRAQPVTRPSVENPHWKKEGCATCHDMASGKAAPIAMEKVDQLCLSCHDGKKAVAEVHPIGRKFQPAAQLVKPDKWPAQNGELGCITCHDSQFACDLKSNTPAANRMFLRDQREVQKVNSFCENCHQEEAYRKINPHLMLTNAGEAIESKCLFCHEKMLDRKAKERSFKPGLKAEQVTICRDCHARHKDATTQLHVGLHVKPDLQTFMYAKEVLGLSSNPSKAFIEKAKEADRVPKQLVLSQEGVIICSTCHNPHQRGLFSEGSDLAHGAMCLNRHERLVSPVREPVWCRHCHGM